MQLYIDRKASLEQRLALKEYIIDDVSRFEILLDMMRRQAMKELNMDPADDFLPAHIANCVPAIMADYESSVDNDLSAIMPEQTEPDIFEILRNHFIMN